MTNKDKFLKDGVSVEEFCKGFYQYLVSKDKISFGYDKSNVGAYLQNFLNEKVKPTLTEEERVILDNIQPRYDAIGRSDKSLYVIAYNSKELFWIYKLFSNHLFQFIKEGEEYSIKELLGDDE